MTQNPIQKDWTPKGTAQTADLECSKCILFICLPPKAHYLRTFAVHYTKGLQAEVNKALHKTKM